MGIFGNKKKVVDWRENYRIPERRTMKRTTPASNDSSSDMDFLGNLANSGTSSSSDVTWDSDSSSSSGSEDYSERIDKRQKTSKKFLEMTNRIEDLDNQVYHLKQRIEVLEKKLKINFR